MNNKVVYTAIFGDYDTLIEPTIKPKGWDFVCFTDNDIQSETWQIRKVLSLYSDNTRTARKHKLLPHRFLPEYEYSLWVDGNILVRNELDDLLKYLDDANYATYNHANNLLDPRDCVYDEAKAILDFGEINMKRNPEKGLKNYKDNPELIINQMNRYHKDNYPKHNGLVVQMQVLRRHNEQDVIKTMEKQWIELKNNSKREQLSFNYTAWKNDLKFNYISGDSRDNEYFLQMGKHKGKVNVSGEYEPISLEYFLSMELQPGGGGKEKVLNEYELKTVKDVFMFYSVPGNVKSMRDKLSPDNWQYFNCMMAGFKKNIENHHDIGWDALTEEYYSSKPDMTDEELEIFLKENPVDFDNGYIRHSYHRACAMIGRLISGKKYIPFYMKREKIYDVPREKDGKHRVLPLISNVKDIQLPEKLLGIPRGEFTICQSGVLALMGIRQNDDIDIIISTEARNQIFNGEEGFIRNSGVEIFEKNKGKFIHFGAQGDDDLIENYSFQVDGYNFLEPRFYFRRKRKDREKDIQDWEGINKFFDMKTYNGYPFNYLSLEQWGVEYL